MFRFNSHSRPPADHEPFFVRFQKDHVDHRLLFVPRTPRPEEYHGDFLFGQPERGPPRRRQVDQFDFLPPWGYGICWSSGADW